MRTAAEISQLKADWEADPCWDLSTTEGFEDHAHELKEYQEACELLWKNDFSKKENELDRQAEELGIKGLYRMILELQCLDAKKQRAIELLTEGNLHEAYKALQGHYPE